MSYVSYEEEADPAVFEDGVTLKAGDVAPSLRGGVLFGDLGPGALVIDAVWRGEVSSDFEETDNEDDTLEGELSVTSFQISLSYLFNF